MTITRFRTILPVPNPKAIPQGDYTLMDVDALVQDPDIKKALHLTRRRIKQRAKVFSDVIDAEGNQYVDLVMEGGGMLGIALVGYTWALEQFGIRFLGIGGTSAGSINALLLAGLDEPANPKSPKLLQELGNMDFFEFVDGGSDARALVEELGRGAGKFSIGFHLFRNLDEINSNLGMNPGDAFTKWLQRLLSESGIGNLADLQARMETKPAGLQVRPDTGHVDKPLPKGRLALVAADISTETKVLFPQMANMYFKFPDKVNPALFARASMSIPFFFEPLVLKGLPRDNDARRRWQEVGYDTDREKGGVPRQALFVDGGIMSNFPIDAFHNPKSVPRMPTFGVKLQYDDRAKQIDGPIGLLGAVFNSARHCLDYDFIRRNPDYRHLVQYIPCQGYDWLNFAMSEKQKQGLFKEGAIAACRFLRDFDWQDYKEIRSTLAQATR